MRQSTLFLAFSLFVLFTTRFSGTSQAQNLPPNFADALVSGGWNAPVGVDWDANGRMYVWEKGGKIWIVQDGVRLAAPLLNISDEVGDWRDHGMLGFTLDPQFLSNGRFYVFYMVDRHHLLYHGTPNYDPSANEYYSASIMRITRYTATGPGLTTADPNSRTILVGETASTGIPVTHESHSTGSLMFGEDGTLLATTGDGASYSSTDVGSAGETYWATCLAEGILRPEENVGAFRAQMVNSLNGKILRMDPNTGDGVASNPWYDASAPRSARSRVWGLGLRNPYRATLRKGTGSTDPADANPGTLYIGDVGWNQWEEINVCYEAGMNFGWPLFEGMEPISSYMNSGAQNLEASNPLYDGLSCTQPYFRFMDLLKQDTPVHMNAHPNACNTQVQIPNTIPKHFHARPSIDFSHGNRSRSGGFIGGVAATFDLDAVDAPVPGPRFGGYAAIAGAFMAGENMPAGYQNSSFHGDYAQGWIRRFIYDENDRPISVHNFATGLGGITWIGAGPDGCVWYIQYSTNQIRRVCYMLSVDLPPVAVASQNVEYGPGPLTVQFTGSASSDPEGSLLSYSWNFGDGQSSTAADPQHLFTAPAGVPTPYTVTLTVTDQGGQSASTSLLVSLNNTPPQVQIISFADGGFFPVGVDTLYQLEALVTDAEHEQSQLSYAWRTTLFHNTHNHPEALDHTSITSTVISGVGCDGEYYAYKVELTVTDPGGLATTVAHWLNPRCQSIGPTAIIHASTPFGMAPLYVEFDGTESYDPGTIVSYNWDFGDGTFSSSPLPTKVFTESGEQYVSLTVTDDDGLSATVSRVITVYDLSAPECIGASGSVTREYFANVAGGSVADLVNSPNFPNNPTSVTYPNSLESPVNFANNFGARVRGYITAPQTGNYILTVTADDNAVVLLSPNGVPQFKQMVCSVTGWTNVGEFEKYPSQTSAAIPMVAGVKYYLEVLHKEGAGGDHVNLYWQTPSNSTRVIVPGSVLSRWEDCGPSLRLRANLQGAWNADVRLMRDDLRAQGHIPTAQPYGLPAFQHVGNSGGETVSPARLLITGKNAIVDWVFVELRSATTPSQVIATRSALLERDGDVVDSNGSTRLFFNVPAGQYLVAIRHRNHLGAMTSTAVTLGPEQAFVDFTSGSTATYGSEARSLLSNGRYGLWSGNALHDGYLKYTGSSNDRDLILTTIGGIVPTAVFNGYHNADMNMDGVVKYTGPQNDRDMILINIGGVASTAVRVQQLP